jgi:hypothetical protein
VSDAVGVIAAGVLSAPALTVCEAWSATGRTPL